ncbi:ABC transporter permease [Desulfofustis limnaeus]|uniref:ABC transporter permease n=1 Tax=Desulfofustis limnaeus TaxID=2740163 RepID=A0ABM7WC92_9BACT|nr:ABC transporter permease [Desulfofustis limnaeus]BDD88628.1 ABC transporter permease [Desulfofustis limnaeus]
MSANDRGVWRKLVSPLLFIAAWWAVSEMGWMPDWFLPSPIKVVQALYSMTISGELLHHTAMSMYRAMMGYFLAAFVGIALGLLIAWSIYVEDFFDPIIELLRPLSTFALVPVFFLWFGIGDVSKILIIFKSCFFPIVLNTIAGIKGVDNKLVKAAQSLGANGRQIWLRVLIPAAMPMIITGLRISTAMSMMALVGVEMISSESGLGFLVIDAQRIFETDRMFAGIIVLSLIGFSLDQCARVIQNRVVSWHIQTSLGGANT